MAGDSEVIHAHHNDTCFCGEEWRKAQARPLKPALKLEKAVYLNGELVCPTCHVPPKKGWIGGPSPKAGGCENILCGDCHDWFWCSGDNSIAFLQHGEIMK